MTKAFAVNGDSAVIYPLPYAMVNTECAAWFKRRPHLTAAQIASARQIEIAGRYYMGIMCETTAEARQLVAGSMVARMCNPFAESA